MNPTQLNTVCSAFQNVDKMSLHEGDPGNTGANDSGETKQTITWSTPEGGFMSAMCTFPDVPAGTYTHVGVWDDTVFITSYELDVTTTTTQDLIILIEHRVEVKS